MQNDEILKIFEESKALLNGHFLLSSGRHSDRYLQCALVLQYPWHAEKLCKALAEIVKPLGPQAVVSPALGGVVVGQELARALGVRAIFTERSKADDKMELRRGFEIKPGEKVFAVEDVITTGKSVRESIAVVRSLGAQVVGVGSLMDRSNGNAAKDFDVPMKSLLSLDVKSWEAGECPMCKQGSPVVKPGSRAKF
jgi:orotate phosphoribosyltransferase